MAQKKTTAKVEAPGVEETEEGTIEAEPEAKEAVVKHRNDFKSWDEYNKYKGPKA